MEVLLGSAPATPSAGWVWFDTSPAAVVIIDVPLWRNNDVYLCSALGMGLMCQRVVFICFPAMHYGVNSMREATGNKSQFFLNNDI